MGLFSFDPKLATPKVKLNAHNLDQAQTDISTTRIKPKHQFSWSSIDAGERSRANCYYGELDLFRRKYPLLLATILAVARVDLIFLLFLI
jgi:hypothetical protein